MRVAYFVITVDRFNNVPIGGVENAIQRYIAYLQERGHTAYVIRVDLTRGRNVIDVPDAKSIDLIHIVAVWSRECIKIMEHYKGKVPVLLSPVYNDRSVMVEHMVSDDPEHAAIYYGFLEELKETIPLACALADRVIVLCNSEREALVNAGAPDDGRYSVVPNGVDASGIRAIASSWRLPRAHAIVCPARIEPNKNQLRLIEAFQEFRKGRDDNVQLWLVGLPFDDAYATRVEQVVKKVGNVHILGLRPTWETLMLMRAARLTVLPSISEVVPLVALESIALGTPVVLTDSSFIEDYLEDAVTYVDPFDSHEIAHAMRQSYGTSVAHGLSEYVLKEYSWERIGRDLLRVYSESIASYEY